MGASAQRRRRALVSIALPVLVVALAVASTVTPESASAFRGGKPWTWLNTPTASVPSAYDLAEDYRPKAWDNVRGTATTWENLYSPRGGSMMQRIRARLPGFKPARFAGVVRVGNVAAIGGYVAWKFCDSVVTADCDFLGLRDTVGTWGTIGGRTTFHYGEFQWSYHAASDAWFLRPVSSSINPGTGTPANGWYNEWYVDPDGAGPEALQWIVHTNGTTGCLSDTTTVCIEAMHELKDVQDTATRGTLVTVAIDATHRRTSRQYADADFQEQLWAEGEFMATPPDTTAWPSQDNSTFTKMPATAPSVPDPLWVIVMDEIAVEDEDVQQGVSVDLQPDYEGLSTGFTMPECVGVTATACVDLLAAAGHTGTIGFVTHDFAGAVVTQPADAVVETIPGGATTDVLFGADVTLTVNPAPGLMPLLLPQPLPTETYAAYLVRLQALGHVGVVTVTELSEAQGEPSLGPGAPVTARYVHPVTTAVMVLRQPGLWPTGNRVLPDTPIEFTKNPPTYPPVDPTTTPPPAGGSGVCFCPVAPFDFTPLQVENGCSTFPFGAFCWIGEQVALFGGASAAPHVTFTHAALATELYVLPADAFRFDVDLADTPAVITDLFPLIRNLLGFTVWLVGLWFLGRRLLGVSTPDAMGSTDDGSTWDENGKYGGTYR